jgi:hypothetical protein
VIPQTIIIFDFPLTPTLSLGGERELPPPRWGRMEVGVTLSSVFKLHFMKEGKYGANLSNN